MAIPKKECKYIKGRYMNTLDCANCRYNRVVDIKEFARGNRRGRFTAGTECLKGCKMLWTKGGSNAKR